MKIRIASLFAGALVLCFSIIAYGQTGTSRVTGTAVDATGAVVPGAKVTLTNEATNASLTTTTTSAGTYVFDSVQLGNYTITAEHGGFKKFQSSGNVLGVGIPLNVNVTFQVGEASDVLEVTASFDRVQTATSGNFGATVDNKTLTDLPLGLESGTGGRNPLIFVRLQPGVVTGANTGGGSHVNGARDRAFNYTLDGIDINESSLGGSEFSPLRTNPDGLQEFRVITSNATAEHGRSSGAQVAMVTKSGSNEFHGNLFYFYRGSALAANEWENNLNKLAKPFLLQHQYGGDVGGPIYLPRFGEGGKPTINGKDRTFFFFNFQLQRQVSPFTRTRNVYTQSAKQGIFRYVVGGRNTAAGLTGASVDAQGNPLLPACSATVTTNCIASYNILQNDPRRLGSDPNSQRILDVIPLPNTFATGDGLNTAGFNYTGGRLDPQQDFVFKIDHKFNNTNDIFVRYSWGKQTTENDTTNTGEPRYPGLPPWVNTSRKPRNLAVSYKRVITPTVVNEFVTGFNRFEFNFINPEAGAQPYSLVTVNPSDPFDYSMGNLRRITTLQFVDNLSWNKGAHLFKGGINFRYQQHKDERGSLGGFNSVPQVVLGTSATVNSACLTGTFQTGGTSGVSGTGQELFCLPSTTSGTRLFINSNDITRLQGTINDILGRVSSVRQGFAAADGLQSYLPAGSLFQNDARYPEYDFYFQDAWKVRRNITVDLGLRNEIKLTPKAEGRLYTPNQLVTVGAATSTTLKWVENNLWENDYNNWSPSIGIAWDPWSDGKTAIRANYRLAYDRINSQVLTNSIYNTIPGITLGVNPAGLPLTGGAGGTNLRLRDGIPSLSPAAGTKPIDQTQPPAFGPGSSISVIDPDFQSPATNQWQIDIQREIPGNIVVNVAYLGRRASHLFGAYNVNQVDIFNNNFLNAYRTVAAGGDSPLFNQLFGPDTRRQANETGSQFVRRQFPTEISRNSVQSIAADAAGRVQSGVPLLTAAGLPLTFFRPFPQFGTLNVIDSNDYSTYHALQVMVQRKFTKGVQFQASYTWGKSLDTRSFDPALTTVSTGTNQSASSTPFNIYNRALNYARSDFDRTHMFIAYGIWDLPFGKGRRFGSGSSGVVRAIIDGWNVNGVLTLQAGRPFTVYSGANQLSNVLSSTADCSGCTRDMGEIVTASEINNKPGYFTKADIAKFSQPAAGSVGNTGRNFFTGPGRWNIDAAILKRTYIREQMNFELRFEFFNLTNTPAFGFPTAVITSTFFGGNDTTGFIANESRKIRIGAKLNF